MKLEDFEGARDLLKGIVRETRLIRSECFSEYCENEVYMKPENMQVTGSYKIRGAYCKVRALLREKTPRGIITSSAGNHAQGVAYAAQKAGVNATIVMPVTTPLVKVNNTKQYGAEVVLEGDFFDEAYQAALRLAAQKGYEMIHPFNDLDIALGQGTMVFEILRDLPDAEVLIVPIGGGGLAAGVSTLAKILNPEIHIIGVEPSGAASMTLSLKNGRISTVKNVQTIADGVAVATPGDIVFPFIRENVDEVLLVEDEELPTVFLDLVEKHKLIAENAGLLSLAVLRKLNFKGRKVVSVISGGNMDVMTMAGMVQYGLVDRRRVFTFSALLPDRPGALAKLTSLVAKHKGNLIRLEHNRFVNVNRNAAVELEITLEAFGREHRDEIMEALKEAGYDAHLSMTKTIT
jgi:threonine dehydratase